METDKVRNSSPLIMDRERENGNNLDLTRYYENTITSLTRDNRSPLPPSFQLYKSGRDPSIVHFPFPSCDELYYYFQLYYSFSLSPNQFKNITMVSRIYIRCLAYVSINWFLGDDHHGHSKRSVEEHNDHHDNKTSHEEDGKGDHSHEKEEEEEETPEVHEEHVSERPID